MDLSATHAFVIKRINNKKEDFFIKYDEIGIGKFGSVDKARLYFENNKKASIIARDIEELSAQFPKFKFSVEKTSLNKR